MGLKVLYIWKKNLGGSWTLSKLFINWIYFKGPSLFRCKKRHIFAKENIHKLKGIQYLDIYLRNVSSLLVTEISFMKVTKIFKQKYHGCSKPIWHQWGHFAHISEPSEIWSNFFSYQIEIERGVISFQTPDLVLNLLSSTPSLQKLIFNFHQILRQLLLNGCKLADKIIYISFTTNQFCKNGHYWKQFWTTFRYIVHFEYVWCTFVLHSIVGYWSQ